MRPCDMSIAGEAGINALAQLLHMRSIPTAVANRIRQQRGASDVQICEACDLGLDAPHLTSAHVAQPCS